MKLDLSALRDAIAALEKSLGYLRCELATDPNLYEQFRAASVQGFEFTYEVAYKMIKRQLKQLATNPSNVDAMTYMQLMRSADEAGLMVDVPRFRNYRDKRKLTGDTCNNKRAEEIVSVIDDFVRDARFLLSELESRNRARAVIFAGFG